MSNEDDEGATLLFKQNRNAIKQLIMDKGALYISYFADGDIHDSAYYYSGQEGSHAVALIGWNDEYPAENFKTDKFGKKPSNDGAWLIRNSWGTGDEDFPDGCFWISYEQDMAFGTAFSMAEADDSLTTYTHGDLGWCLSWGMGDNGDKTFYGASVFMAGNNDVELKEIGFYTTDNNADAEFSIYVSDAKPTASTLTAGQPMKTISSKDIPYAGYHTVTLDSSVSVKAGQYLTIIQKAVNPSYGYPLAATAKINNWSDFAEFYDGEGYVSSNGTEWTDGIQLTENGERRCITPCIYAYVSGASDDDDGRDTLNMTIDGILVKDMESFTRELNVAFDTNEKLNPNIPSGRVFNLTLGGKDGSAVKAGESFTLYLLYVNDVLKWEEQSASESGVRYPSGDIVPLYPTDYKPDIFLTAKVTDEASLKADLPAYGPFEATAGTDGKITLNVDGLTYNGPEGNGSRAKIPTGYHYLLYFQQTDTETSACGMIEDINVTSASSGSSGSSSSGFSGCDVSMAGGLALILAGMAVFFRKR